MISRRLRNQLRNLNHSRFLNGGACTVSSGNRSNKSVPAAGKRFYVARLFGVICQSDPNLVDAEVYAVIEVDESGIRPQLPLNRFARHQLSGALDQKQQDDGRVAAAA
jgi:hypothetical protein